MNPKLNINLSHTTLNYPTEIPIYRLDSIDEHLRVRLLKESGFHGEVLVALFGYNRDPSLTEMLAYALYFGVVLLGLRRAGMRSAPAAQRQA